jgi:hypothetical protein
MSIQSRLETVKAARQRYDHLAGVARAHAICAFVVWEHRAEGWGRFKKSTSNGRTGSTQRARSPRPVGSVGPNCGLAAFSESPRMSNV